MHTFDDNIRGEWIIEETTTQENCSIDWETGNVYLSEHEVKHLSRTPLKTLKYLIANKPYVMTHNMIYEKSTGKTPFDAKNLVRNYILTIRKISDIFEKCISTMPGVGYSFVGRAFPVSGEEVMFAEEVGTDSPQLDNREFRDRVHAMDRNICLTTKQRTEAKPQFPLANKLAGVQRMTLLNFAGTTFLSSSEIASVYTSNDEYKEWLIEQLRKGALYADIILNNPHSYAAEDAALCKMYPEGLDADVHDIIQSNVNTVLEFRENNPKANVHLYLTDICLPYGIMQGQNYSDPSINFMKVDLYSPLTGNDKDRLSFFLLEEDSETGREYTLFEKVINDVKNHVTLTRKFEGPDVSWLTEKTIIHRGRFSQNTKEHSVRGYLECIRNGYPMEVDILFLSDGNPIVGREESLIYKDDYENKPENAFKLSSLTLSDLKRLSSADYRTTNGQELCFQLEELMTLSELLDMVNGRVGLLIEVKAEENSSQIQTYAKKIVETLRYYSGRYAIHSANPYVLKEIRECDRMVALGQISWSFEDTGVSEEYKQIHQEFKFVEIVKPNFISYKLGEIRSNSRLQELCRKMDIPLLAWTVYNKGDDKEAQLAGCNNVIIEGAPHF